MVFEDSFFINALKSNAAICFNDSLEPVETFDVQCPEFYMKALPYLRLKDCASDAMDDT